MAILGKTATLFRYAGENGVGEAKYIPTVLRKVYYTMTTGEEAANDAPEDKLILYVFDTRSEAGDANAARQEIREGDIIVPGKQEDTTRPLSLPGARRVLSVTEYRAGSARMWHRKVVAK